MKYVTVSGTATQLIENGETITVYQIIGSTNGNQFFTLYERDGSTVIQVVNLSATPELSIEIGTEFVARNGLAVSGNLGGLSITVFYSQGGA